MHWLKVSATNTHSNIINSESEPTPELTGNLVEESESRHWNKSLGSECHPSRQRSPFQWDSHFDVCFLTATFMWWRKKLRARWYDHFMCDPATFLQISCSDTQLAETMGFISALMTLVVPLSMVFTSRTYNALTILKIPSTNERKKAFLTYSSHMIVIFFSNHSCILMYVKPSVKENLFKSE